MKSDKREESSQIAGGRYGWQQRQVKDNPVGSLFDRVARRIRFLSSSDEDSDHYDREIVGREQLLSNQNGDVNGGPLELCSNTSPSGVSGSNGALSTETSGVGSGEAIAEVTIAQNDYLSQGCDVPSSDQNPSIRGKRRRVEIWEPADEQVLWRIVPNYLNVKGQVQRMKLKSKWDELLGIGEVSTNRSPKALVMRFRKLEREQNQPHASDSDEPPRKRASSENTDPSSMIDSMETGLVAEEPKADSEDKVSEKSFVKLFNAKRKNARKGTSRQALPKPKRPVPGSLLNMGNKVMGNWLNRFKRKRNCLVVPMIELNAAVYAVGQTITHLMSLENEVASKQAKEFRKVLECKCTELKQWLGKIRSIIDRLKRKKPHLSFKQLRTLTAIKKRFGNEYKHVSELETLYLDLSIEHRNATKANSVKNEELIRRRERKSTLSVKALDLLKDREEVGAPVEVYQNYWYNYIGVPKGFKLSEQIQNWAGYCKQFPPAMDPSQLSLERIREMFSKVLRKARPWKATGRDGIHNFWWKSLPEANEELLQIFLTKLNNPESRLPKWFCHGRAILLPKKGPKEDPANSRTIACLNSAYKLWTGLLTKWLNLIIEGRDILPEPQVALKSGIWGVQEAHVIHRTIVSDAKTHGRSLFIGYFDFAKAFDSVSHSLIRWVLEVIGVSENMRVMIKKLIKLWTLTYECKRGGVTEKGTPMAVRNGVLQGDTLSPLLFCLCIAPISYALMHDPNFEGEYSLIHGSRQHEISNQLPNHVYYMDDLVIFAPSRETLSQMIRLVEGVSSDLGLNINKSKSATYVMKRTVEAIHDSFDEYPLLSKNETYKYLGLPLSSKLEMTEVWKSLEEKILARVRIIFSSRWTIRQKIIAYNAAIAPMVTFISQNVIIGNGPFKSLLRKGDALEAKIRRLIQKHKIRSRYGCKARLFLRAESGGIGFKSIRHAMEDAVVYSYAYIRARENLLISRSFMLSLDKSNRRNIISDLAQIFADYGIEWEWEDRANWRAPIHSDTLTATKYARFICCKLNEIRQETLMREWRSKKTSSDVLNCADIDLDLSFLWLEKGAISSAVLRSCLAVQECALQTKTHKMNKGKYSDMTCRMKCHEMLQYNGESLEIIQPYRETARHIVTECHNWRQGLGVCRHNEVARTMYNDLCIQYGFEPRLYQRKIEGIRRKGKVMIFWNQAIKTTRAVRSCKPDIVVVDENQRKILIVEVGLCWRSRLLETETRKYAKYAINSIVEDNYPLNSRGTYDPDRNLKSELGADWNCKVEVVPIVLGVCGEVTANLKGNIEKLGFNHKQTRNLIARMQKCSVLGTHRIVKAHMSFIQTSDV